jgi:hypothetical protein
MNQQRKITFYYEGVGKLIIEKENEEWHFNVFHYLKPLKNYVYVATVSVDNFKEGLEEAVMFLSFDLHFEMYQEKNND